MIRKMLRLLSLLTSIAIMLSFIAGCKGDTDSEESEYVYVSEFFSVPGTFEYVTGICSTDDKIFFASRITLNEKDGTYTAKIFSVSVDGTALIELEDYVPAYDVPGAKGGVHIQSIRVDSNGNIFIEEHGHFYEPGATDVNETVLAYSVLRKLTDTGIEIDTILDLTEFQSSFSHLKLFGIDIDGNIYLHFSNMTHSNTSVIVFNNEGSEIFRLRALSNNSSLIRLSDGSIFLADSDSNSGFTLSKINPATQALDDGYEIEFSGFFSQIYPADGDFDVLLRDHRDLYVFSMETGETVKLFDRVEADVIFDNVFYIKMLKDGRILFVERAANRAIFGRNRLSLVILEKKHISEVSQERTVLKLASLGGVYSHYLFNAVMQFNRMNQEYYIEIDLYDDLMQLTTAITAGQVPDLLDVSGLPFRQYATSGLFKDLYDFIDSDPALDRSDFFESVLRAVEVDNGLYQLFPAFNIDTIVGNSLFLDDNMGWNISEFKAVIENNPETARYSFSKADFVQSAVILSIDDYIDRVNGSVHFNTDEFIQLLEFANTLTPNTMLRYFDQIDMLTTGELIIANVNLGQFTQIQIYHTILDSNVVFKGFPTESRNGNLLSLNVGVAITTKCVSDEGAWEYVRMLLDKDWQMENYSWGFPLNKEAFNMILSFENSLGRKIHAGIELQNLTQEDIDRFYALIDSLTSTVNIDTELLDIILEGVNDYFNGRTTAPDTARIIQSRASIYLSEQN